MQDRERLTKIAEAINGYYLALNTRQHGGIAMANAFKTIERVMEMNWLGQKGEPPYDYHSVVLPAWLSEASPEPLNSGEPRGS